MVHGAEVGVVEVWCGVVEGGADCDDEGVLDPVVVTRVDGAVVPPFVSPRLEVAAVKWVSLSLAATVRLTRQQRFRPPRQHNHYKFRSQPRRHQLS